MINQEFLIKKAVDYRVHIALTTLYDRPISRITTVK